MRGFVIASFLLVVLATRVVHGSPAGSCTSFTQTNQTQFLADDADCSVFYECLYSQPTKVACPAGLEFNIALQVCDWPVAAGCSVNKPSSTSTSTAATTPADKTTRFTRPASTNIAKVSTTSPPGVRSTIFTRSHLGKRVTVPIGVKTTVFTRAPSSTEAPPSIPAKVVPLEPLDPTGCPAIGRCPKYEDENSLVVQLPHAYNCSRFCKCDHGKPVTFACPTGLQFNATAGICDWPSPEGCLPDRGFTASWSATRPPVRIPVSTESSIVAIQPCDTLGACPRDDRNSTVTNLPHRTDCSLYCTCRNGIALTQKCPDGLHFNAALEVCDWPTRAMCA